MERIQIGEKVEIRLQITNYKNKQSVNIRRFVFTDKYEGPTPVGIPIPIDKIDELIDKLQKIKEEII